MKKSTSRKNPYEKSLMTFLPLCMRSAEKTTYISMNPQVTAKSLGPLLEPTERVLNVGGVSFALVSMPRISKTLRIFPEIEMTATECTQALFENVMGFNYSKFKDTPNAGENPVENVTWYDAVMFCNKLSVLCGFEPCYKITEIKYGDKEGGKKKTSNDLSIRKASVTIINRTGVNRGFRLPTDTEWMYFATTSEDFRKKASTDTANLYGWIVPGKTVTDYAWTTQNSGGTTHPVGTLLPNPWGMYDILGNVCEWCEDTKKAGDDAKEKKVTKGEAFDTMKSASLKVFYNKPSTRDEGIGFRFCRNKD